VYAWIGSPIAPLTATEFANLCRILSFKFLRFLIAYPSVLFIFFNSQHPHHKHIFLTKPKTAFISRTWHSIRAMQAKRYRRGFGKIIVDSPSREVAAVR